MDEGAVWPVAAHPKSAHSGLDVWGGLRKGWKLLFFSVFLTVLQRDSPDVSHCDSVTGIDEHNVMNSGVLTSWISADGTRQQKEAHASMCLWIAVRYWEI